MSPVNLSLPSWPPLIELNDGQSHQVIILWIYCLLFMLLLPLLMSYYYYALYKLRFLMALRRRHLKLLTFLYITILTDFICIEPIRLFCGTYLSHLSILYWLYLILSTLSTHIILYIVLLKVWLLFFDLKWTKVCVIHDNQWRYHINNPLHSPESEPPKNGQKSAENEEKNTMESLTDMSWFVRRRQSFGNIQYLSKYVSIIVLISVIISLLSKCLFQQSINEAVTNGLILIPILFIYVLWLNTPQFSDVFYLRKEMKYLLIYCFVCVVINTVIDVLLYANQSNLSYWIELELVLIFVYHFIVFGIFMFLVCYPMQAMKALYGDRMYGALNEDNRTHSIAINEERVPYHCCLCFISLKFIQKIALFDAKMGINHKARVSGKESMDLRLVNSSSQTNNNNLSKENNIEMTSKKQSKTKTEKDTQYKFNNIAGVDEDESNSVDFNFEGKDEEETATLHCNTVPIKPAQNGQINIDMRQTDTGTETKSNSDKFKLLESELGFELFLAHCSGEFSLENVFAIIELNQYQTYCKKQEKYRLKQAELRIKSAKQRFKKKKESIRRVKAKEKEGFKNKKEKLKLLNRESQTLNNNHSTEFKNFNSSKRQKRHSMRKRRKQRIKQFNLESDMIENDELILDQIASKPPISTQVSGFLDFKTYDSYTDSGDYEQKENESEFEFDGNAGDDEEDDRDELALFESKTDLNIHERMANLPESSIVNQPFIVHSKNRRIRQLEEICMELCQKYIFCESMFQLNLPKHIISEMQRKIEGMKQSHIRLKNSLKSIAKTHQRTHTSSVNHTFDMAHFDINKENLDLDLNSSDSDLDAQPMPAVNKLQLTQKSESNFSNIYPRDYESRLHLFFDHIIQLLFTIIDDSVYRFKLTKEYREFVGKSEF